jgi:hypothetical protein
MPIEPLAIERDIIDLETAPPNLDAVAPLEAGLRAGQTVENKLEDTRQIAEATEFEKLLQSGEEGMNLALKDAEAQGVDLTGIPDPKLYLQTKDDSANWYSILSEKLETHQKKTASKEAFTSISTGSPEEAQQGIGKLVGTGQVDALQGAQAARKFDFERRQQEFFSGKTKVVPTGTGEEGAVEIDIESFVAPTGTLGAPDDIKVAAESAAKKLSVPTDLLLSIAKRESSFDPNARPINKKTGERISSAFGLGQLIDSTAKDIFSKAQAQGLIGKDVELEDARANPEMNLIMTGVLFKENLKAMGNVRDALLAHRLGVGGAREFLKTGKAMVNGVDEAEDVNDWIGDVMGGALPDGATGIFSDGSPNLNTVEGIDSEIQRIVSSTDFGSTPQGKQAVIELQKKRALLSKGKGKGKVGKQEQNTAGMIDLVVALADNVTPSGALVGNIKNFLAPFNVDTANVTLKQFSGLLAGQLAKGVGGESGRLTDQDRAFAMAAMPNANDNEETRANKIAILTLMSNKLKGALEGDVESQEALSKALFTTAGRNGSPMTEDQLVKSFKRNPRDEAIKAFLWSNGKDATPENVAKIKAKLQGSSASATPAAPAISPGATTIQSGSDAASQTPAPNTPEGGFGGTLNIPGI